MPKCDFNKVAHGCSLANLLPIFRTPLKGNTSVNDYSLPNSQLF